MLPKVYFNICLVLGITITTTTAFGIISRSPKQRKSQSITTRNVTASAYSSQFPNQRRPQVGEKCIPLRSWHVKVRCMFQDKEVSCNHNMRPGTIATPRCEAGYIPSHKSAFSHLKCLNNGYWDNPMIYCIPALCPPLMSRNTNLKCTISNKKVPCDKPMQTGTVATAECKANYKPTNGPENPRLTCQSNGRWDHELLNCAAVCGFPSENSKLETRIMDGKEAHTGAFPWHAGLFYRKMDGEEESWVQRCGGSLITDLFVLTAAHCVVDNEVANVRIALGKIYRSWDRHEPTEEKRNVSKILHPKEFNQMTYLFDIALLVMDKRVDFGQFIKPVCTSFLHGSSNIMDNKLYVVGWGQTTDVLGGGLSEILLYNDVMRVPMKVCRKHAPSVYPIFDKFCTVTDLDSEVSVVQPGDSGGGVTALHEGLHYIFGVVSIKFNKYSAFTNITWPYNMQWSEGEIKKYYSDFRWVESSTAQFEKSSRRCVLPEATTGRTFCSTDELCDECNVNNTTCTIPPGTEVDSVRVVCVEGYRLQIPHVGGGYITTCLADGSWYPQIPDCIMNHCGEVSDGEPCVCDTGNEFKCTIGPCFPLSYQCDGDFDCPDASDELNCSKPNCTEERAYNAINCKRTTGCIIPSDICDGENDCGDNSDEEGCDYYTNNDIKDDGNSGRYLVNGSLLNDEYSQDFKRECVLPEKRPGRIFCWIGVICQNCNGSDKSCIILPGTEMAEVRVGCSDGYSLQTTHTDGGFRPLISTCLADGSWQPQIPECIKDIKDDGNSGRYLVNGSLLNDGYSQDFKRNCVLPEKTPGRIFCWVRGICQNCNGSDKSCIIPPGTEMAEVSVRCSDGYSLQTTHTDGVISTCLGDGSWQPQIPECIKSDCKDGENDCYCNPDSDFQCTTGPCLSGLLKCNGEIDCPDGSDELNCLADCDDDSDELNCQCDTDNEFQCTIGPCFPYSYKCDEHFDCPDASDELNCAKPECTEWSDDAFNCKRTTACIIPSDICDGENDCGDNSDEEDCDYYTNNYNIRKPLPRSRSLPLRSSTRERRLPRTSLGSRSSRGSGSSTGRRSPVIYTRERDAGDE